jgi:DNA polymerase
MKSQVISQYLELLVSSGIDEIRVRKSEKVEPELEIMRFDQEPEDFLLSREEDCKTCTKCILHKGRINTVYGTGNPKAKLMLIGEAPGSDENKQGIPFVGRAGQLLTKMLQAINLERDEVYIANTVKCQPPRNRDPLPDEVAACMPYLREQIAAIKPKLILLLGRVAAASILQEKDSMSNMRAREYTFEGIRTFISYHPAALLYDAKLKKFAWEDLQKIRDIYNLDTK